MIDLAGLRVLVTGGSRGIGAACCELLAAAGASLAVHYRAEEAAARALVDRLPETTGPSHLLHAADLRREEAIGELFDSIGAEWGGLDCLVNNAGVWVANPVAELDSGRLRDTLAMNLEAPFLCLRHALPLLRRSQLASVVNIASTAGQRGEAGYSPYAATKGGLIAATKSWAVELAPAIRVNAVAPGWVDTDMCRGAFAGGGRERIEATIPLGRVAAPEDIAGPVVFLASPLARHITGAVLSVNGGGVLAG